MSAKLSTWRAVGLVAVSVVVFPRTAHAYLDPGTGSLIVQGLIAAVLGATLTIRLMWGKIKVFVTERLLHRKRQDSTVAADDR